QRFTVPVTLTVGEKRKTSVSAPPADVVKKVTKADPSPRSSTAPSPAEPPKKEGTGCRRYFVALLVAVLMGLTLLVLVLRNSFAPEEARHSGRFWNPPDHALRPGGFLAEAVEGGGQLSVGKVVGVGGEGTSGRRDDALLVQAPGENLVFLA